MKTLKESAAPGLASEWQKVKMLIKMVPLVVAAASLPAADSIHGFAVRSMDGKEQSLAAYAGQVVLIVNVASK